MKLRPTQSFTLKFIDYTLYLAMATGGADLLNAVVIGATGATGKCLVGSLLKAKVGQVSPAIIKLANNIM